MQLSSTARCREYRSRNCAGCSSPVPALRGWGRFRNGHHGRDGPRQADHPVTGDRAGHAVHIQDIITGRADGKPDGCGPDTVASACQYNMQSAPLAIVYDFLCLVGNC